MRYTCCVPSRLERKAITLPSGDHCGRESRPLRVSCLGSPPEVETSQMLLTERLAPLSGVDTLYATHLPSGEICASLRRSNRTKSSNVMGRFAGLGSPLTFGAVAATTRTQEINTEYFARFIFPPRGIMVSED
jgi:hypothetical protein